ncbi:hypothetical protein SAMN05660489_06353 [Pseudomonas sp. LAMO17WK12:I10]|nr:hypothetical protein H160_06366 [Pseudomonas sp. LAMO17WK12:I9]SNY54002.1 hypothetical protein SAMN05660489_06353 [Pseudomonas sp. LAMO17WK12:I10]
MCFVLSLQAILQIESLRLVHRRLPERCYCGLFTLAPMRQVFRSELPLIPGCLPFQLFGLPPPGEARTSCSAEHQGEQHPPRSQGHQISTCSARL